MSEVNYMPLHLGRPAPRMSIEAPDPKTNATQYHPAAQGDCTCDLCTYGDNAADISDAGDPSFGEETSGETLEVSSKASEAPPELVSKQKAFILRSWWREIIAMFISVAALVAVAGILLAYQNQPLSRWRFRYLPNSVISQLMTISRSALMFSTASTVSQALWHYVRQEPRSLIEIQAFDDASRGPFGAILMLAHATRYCFPGLLGSFITVATLLMESFTQQVLQYPLRTDLAKANGTFPMTQYFVYAQYQQLSTPKVLNSSIQAEIVDSLSGNPPSDAFACPTSSCSWETASTLGICSACKDVTIATKTNCSSNPANLVCNHSTPGGFFLQTYGIGLEVYTAINTTTRFDSDPRTSTLISFASVVWNGTLAGTPPSITECTLSWCAKTYREANTQNGVFSATVENEDLEYAYTWEEGLPVLVYWNVFKTRGDNLLQDSNTTFTIHERNSESFGGFIDTTLKLGVSNGYTQVTSGSLGAGTFDFGNLMLNNPTISDMGESLAKGLTNIIRNRTTPYADQVLGRSYVQVQYIRVRWQWSIFPASIVFLGLLLLLFTIVQSHLSATIIWKTSPLALLFHPLQGWTNEDLNRNSRSDMMDSAKCMRGQLVYNVETGYRIVRNSALVNRSLEI